MLEVKEQAVLVMTSERMVSLAAEIRNGDIIFKIKEVLLAWLCKGSPVKVRTVPVPLPLP